VQVGADRVVAEEEVEHLFTTKAAAVASALRDSPCGATLHLWATPLFAAHETYDKGLLKLNAKSLIGFIKSQTKWNLKPVAATSDVPPAAHGRQRTRR
jgi:hypothetical protein